MSNLTMFATPDDLAVRLHGPKTPLELLQARVNQALKNGPNAQGHYYVEVGDQDTATARQIRTGLQDSGWAVMGPTISVGAKDYVVFWRPQP